VPALGRRGDPEPHTGAARARAGVVLGVLHALLQGGDSSGPPARRRMVADGNGRGRPAAGRVAARATGAPAPRASAVPVARPARGRGTLSWHGPTERSVHGGATRNGGRGVPDGRRGSQG